MLSSLRHKYILNKLDQNGSVSTADLIQQLQTSVSTIRRDLDILEKQGKLIRIHGGAVLVSDHVVTSDHQVQERRNVSQSQKQAIGKRAASLIQPGDFVYIDAGTTTEAMLSYIAAADVHYVTNGISQAKILAQMGAPVTLLGGQFKPLTEATVGEESILALEGYNFSKGFFGTNGIDASGRLMTPDRVEAATKKAAMKACCQKYILADSNKLLHQSRYVFGSLENCTLITDEKSRENIPEETKVIFV